MDPEDETGSAGQGQNLHDLQNYLSTFNKEIEPGDDVLSNMDVDSGVGDVSDLYSSNPENPLQEPGEGTVTSQFSSGFYSEQGILDTPLSDESAQQIQNIVSGTDRDTDADMTAIKQEVGSIDLEAVQAQIAGFGDARLSHSIGDIHTSSLPQGLIMASLGDNLDPSAGKVIRIVSLSEEGQYLSLADGSQMQILNQDLGISADTLSTSDGSLGTEVATTLTSSANATSILASVGATGVVVTGRGSIMTSASDTITSNTITGGAQLVTIQSTSDSSQSHLVALSQGTAEALQISGLLAADGTISSDLGYQTITILPSDLNHNGDMNYMLIMTPQDAQKDGGQPLAQLVEGLKQENQELTEELMEIDGEMKRVLRVIPKKFIAANFGAQLMCDYCDYTSPKRYLLTRHMKSHSDERPHKCKECDRGFKTPASLLNHINTHTGTRPHKCKTCEAAFTTSGELVRHIRYRHTFEKPHRCPDCDYASVELSKLKRHMRSHTGERPYKCPHCPYASPDTYKLKRHLRIHTGEKPYECDICHARFTQSNSLKAHKLIHSGNKPVFQCDLCPTTCGRKTDLKIHFNKLHSMGSPLECKKCGQVFSDRYSYKQHVRGHDVDKCLKCDQCDFVANTERTYDQHAAVHTNGKKFECDTCQNSFNLKQALEKHKVSCNLGAESGMDSQSSSSRDKEQNKEDGVFSLDGSNSSPVTSGQLVSGLLASDTLHKNLLQDIKAGKLGNVPQVVIVHPDGSLEEISSKGDKLNLEDIFSALSNNGRAESTPESREKSQAKGSNEGVVNAATDIRKQKDDLSDEDDDDEEEEENGGTSQCEASTQAELESDTDSVDDDSRSVYTSPHFSQTAGKESQHLMSSTRSESTENQSASSDVETTSSHITETSSDALGSLLQSLTTSAASMSSATTLSSLLPFSSDQAVASSQQFVVVKGYTCLSGDAAQPTLVNVAVDKDSLMKMFASLASSGESGMQLVTGDLESSIALSIENSQATILPLTQLQLHHIGHISGLPNSLIVGSNFEQADDSNTAHDQALSKSESFSTDSDSVSKDKLSPVSEADISVTTCIDSQLRDIHDLPISHESACPEPGIFANSSTSINMNPQAENTSLSSSPNLLVSLKMSLSNEQLVTDSHMNTDRDISVKPSFSNEQIEPETLQGSKCDSAAKICLSNEYLESGQFHSNKSVLGDISTDSPGEYVQEVLQTVSPLPIGVYTDKCASLNTDTSLSQGSSGTLVAITAHNFQSITNGDNSEDISEAALSGNVREECIPSDEKHKRSNRKRTAATDVDQSLVMTGKRVRKTLVKVSM